MKLNHYLASAGICSRRNAAELVKEGLVTVNGAVVREPWFEVGERQKVAYNGKPVVCVQKIYVLLNKPKGYVTTVNDELGRNTVIDLLYPDIKERMFPVGRLDRLTTGLLVLTNDGNLAQQLAHPRYAVQKVYEVSLDKPLEEREFKKIERGMVLDGERVIVDMIKYVSPRSKVAVRLTIHSGKNRVIRRIFERLGFEVKTLDRVSYGFLSKRDLPVGRWRYLTPGEVKRFLGTDKEKNGVNNKKRTPSIKD